MRSSKYALLVVFNVVGLFQVEEFCKCFFIHFRINFPQKVVLFEIPSACYLLRANLVVEVKDLQDLTTTLGSDHRRSVLDEPRSRELLLVKRSLTLQYLMSTCL